MIFSRQRKLRDAYRQCFLDTNMRDPSHPGRVILADLTAFCRASEPCVKFDTQGRIDPIGSAYLEGRREVFLRLNYYLNLPEAVLQKIEQDTSDD